MNCFECLGRVNNQYGLEKQETQINAIVKEQLKIQLSDVRKIKFKQVCEFAKQLIENTPNNFEYNFELTPACAMSINLKKLRHSKGERFLYWRSFDSSHVNNIIVFDLSEIDNYFNISKQVEPFYDEFLCNWESYLMTGTAEKMKGLSFLQRCVNSIYKMIETEKKNREDEILNLCKKMAEYNSK